jgi:hypothetical protein
MAVVAGVLLLTLLFHAHQHDTLGPRSNHNDSNYYYVLAGTAVVDGSGLPRFAHPGLNVMLHLGWYFRGLKAAGLVPAASEEEFRSSPDPFRDMLLLFLAGKLFSVAVGLAFLVLSYAVVLRLTKDHRLAALTATYSLLTIGLVEQMFVLRPELTSAVFALGAFLVCLTLPRARGISGFLGRIVAAAALFAMAVMAKVMALFLAPLFCPSILRSLRVARDLDRLRCTLAMGVLWGACIALGWPWAELLRPQYVAQALADRHVRSALSLLPVLHGCGLVALAALLTTSLLSLLDLQTARARALRAGTLGALGALVGGLASLWVLCLNWAESPVAWAQKLVFTATTETVHYIMSGAAFSGNAMPSGYALVAEVRDIATHLWTVAAVLAAGWWCAGRTDRRHLGGLGLLLGILAVGAASRGAREPIVYYRIYALVLAVPIIAIAGRHLLRRVRRGWAVVIAVTLTLLLGTDAWRTAASRARLFEQRIPPLTEVMATEYWTRGVFFRTVLRPRYCVDLEDNQACAQELARRLAYGQDQFIRSPQGR